jgi:UDP:flavonoid glycosyltransferase YjiC (YdhE family)
LLPTAQGPSTLAAVRPRSTTRLNTWAGSLALAVTAGMATTTGRHLRDRLGLRHTSARGFVDLVRRTPALAAMSPLVVPPASDWPETAVSTGFWMESGPAGEPDPQLRDFVAAGPAPVCVGFGSVGDTDVDLVTAAARQARQRVVVVAPEATAGPGMDMTGALVVRAAPFRWLFPRSAAVIHHGGAGTTAESLLAGRPTGVVATGADQPYFGHRVAELGAGPPPLRRRDLTVDRLATLMTALTGPDSSFRSYADEIAAERGAATAADHIVARRL